MAVFGSTINPALGRVDYSPLAQGMAQGGALAAQGMAAMGQGLSEGFREYVKKREQNAILEGKNAALLREIGRDPMLASNPEIQKYTAKMAKGGGLTLNDNIKMHAELTTTAEAARMRQEEKRQQDYLKLQQDAAAINAERAAREKAEYERRNTANTTFMRGLVSGKAKTPEEIVMLGAASGMSPDEIRQATGMAIDLNNYQQANDKHKLNLKTAQMEYDNKVAAYQRAKDKGNPEFEVMTANNGVSFAVFRDPLTGSIIKTDQIELAKPNVGEKTQRNALEYHIAESRGDAAGMAKALINIKSDNAKATENLSDEEIRQSFIDPFVPRVGGEVAPTEPLRVTGAPKPVSAPPAPSPEAARITQSPNVAPSATPASPQPSLPSGPAPVIQIPNEDGLSAPPSRGAQPLIPQSIGSSSIPFGPATVESTFLDREAQATDRGAYRPFDVAMAERYQTPAQGAIPQIKLSPAAQKIASELRKSAQSGERGKAPQFFLEASTGDNGKRTRVKLDRNELFAILTNNPMPNLSPTIEVDREETRRLMEQQMRMNELMRQYRPPPRRSR